MGRGGKDRKGRSDERAAVSDVAASPLNLMRDAFSAAVEATTKAQEQTLRLYDDLAKRGGLAQQQGQRLLED